MQNPTLAGQIAVVEGYIKSLEKLVAAEPGPCVAASDLETFKAIRESLKALQRIAGRDLFPLGTHNPPR